MAYSGPGHCSIYVKLIHDESIPFNWRGRPVNNHLNVILSCPQAENNMFEYLDMINCKGMDEVTTYFLNGRNEHGRKQAWI